MQCPICSRPLRRYVIHEERITLWRCDSCRMSWDTDGLVAEKERVLS